MRRIVIVGASGSGKSRLATALGLRLGLPAIHADRLFWKPGWTDPDNDAYRAEITRLAAGEAWIFDGIPGRVPDIVLPRADAVIWIEQPAWLCMVRAYGRTLRHLGRNRPDMGEGCPERLTLAPWRYATTFDRVQRPRLDGWLAEHAPATPVVRLRGDRAVARFVGTVA